MTSEESEELRAAARAEAAGARAGENPAKEFVDSLLEEEDDRLAGAAKLGKGQHARGHPQLGKLRLLMLGGNDIDVASAKLLRTAFGSVVRLESD